MKLPSSVSMTQSSRTSSQSTFASLCIIHVHWVSSSFHSLVLDIGSDKLGSCSYRTLWTGVHREKWWRSLSKSQGCRKGLGHIQYRVQHRLVWCSHRARHMHNHDQYRWVWCDHRAKHMGTEGETQSRQSNLGEGGRRCGPYPRIP
jgi:hypothetical protein